MLIFRNNKSHDSAVESWESGNSELSQNSSSNHGKARQPRNPNFSRSFLAHFNPALNPFFSHTLGHPNPRHRASDRRSNEFGSLARLPARDRAHSDRHIPQASLQNLTAAFSQRGLSHSASLNLLTKSSLTNVNNSVPLEFSILKVIHHSHYFISSHHSQ